eukprot:m.137460 g.137460  ORF g.137460 m.137460 type:complete len:486 (-) comp20231_c0_seq2:222-1679(-)
MANDVSTVTALYASVRTDTGEQTVVCAVCTMAGAVDQRQFLERLRGLVQRNPRFRSVLKKEQGSPGKPDRVSWEELDAAAVNWDNHLSTCELDGPFSSEGMYRCVEREMEAGVSRAHPLFRVLYVRGQASAPTDETALCFLFDHCLGDGVSLMRSCLSVFDNPEQIEFPTLRAGTGGGKKPFGLAGLARTVLRLPRLLAVGVTGSLHAVLFGVLPADPDNIYKLKDINQTAVHKDVSGARGQSLAELSAFKNKFSGLTLNDVLVAVLVRTLQTYAQTHNAPLPRKNLRAFVPISLRAANDDDVENKWVIVPLPLPVTKREWLPLLREVKNACDDLKASPEGFIMMKNLGLAVQKLDTKKLCDTVLQVVGKVSVNFTNVPGPVQQVSMAGVPVKRMQFFMATCAGTVFAVTSYNGQVYATGCTDPACAIDTAALMKCWEQECNALLQFGEGRPNVNPHWPLWQDARYWLYLLVAVLLWFVVACVSF